jgi:RNA polymerase sigma-70 factor (ECF subfamily)
MFVHPSPEDPIGVLADLVRTHRATLVGVARREGLAPEDAVESVQDAFGTFLQLLRRGDVPGSAEEWPQFLVTVTRNAARNRRRRHHRSRPHEPLDPRLENAASSERSTEELVADAEEHVRLRACVDQLCGTQRAVVTLRLLEERDGEDVAALLGIRRGHVDVLLHRAKASLRACMTA